MSKNWTYSAKLCFLKKLPQQYFPWRNPVKSKTQIKMTTKNYRVMSCKVCQIGYRSSSMDLCSRTSRHFQVFWWITNGAASKSGIGLGLAQCQNSLPERSKLWHLLEDKNYKGVLQKTYWYSRAQSGTFWWFSDIGSESSQWMMRIPTQSSIRCCGTRLGNPVVTILPTQNKNFSGHPEELTEVPGADKETTSHLHWELLRIWQVLWRIILESLYVNTTDQKQMGLLKEQCAEWNKGHLRCYCSPVQTTNGGRILMLLLSAKHSRSLVWWEDTIWESGSECHLTDQ